MILQQCKVVNKNLLKEIYESKWNVLKNHTKFFKKYCKSKSCEKIMYKRRLRCIYLHFTKEYLYVHALISMRKVIKKKIIIANYISYHFLYEKLG